MLQKTPQAKVEPLHTRKDVEKIHGRMGRAIDRLCMSMVGLRGLAQSINNYARTRPVDLFPSGKSSSKLKEGEIAYRDNPARISCGNSDERKAVFELLKERGKHHCINHNPSFNETALREECKDDPALLKAIREVAPSFSLGSAYTSFTISWAGKEWKVTGNAETGEFTLAPVE